MSVSSIHEKIRKDFGIHAGVFKITCGQKNFTLPFQKIGLQRHQYCWTKIPAMCIRGKQYSFGLSNQAEFVIPFRPKKAISVKKMSLSANQKKYYGQPKYRLTHNWVNKIKIKKIVYFVLENIKKKIIFYSI
jgi:hypothetical protein